MGRKKRPQKRQRAPAGLGSPRQSPSRPVTRAGNGPRWGLILGVAAALALIAVAVGVVTAAQQANAPVPTATAVSDAARIDGIPCNDDPADYHQHSFLALVINGKDVAVPANIGIIDDTCIYWLHTHDNSGELHLEAPYFQPFTLGQFFDVWGQPLSRTQIWKYKVSKGERMLMYLNGKVYRGDPRAIPLRRHNRITLEIGPPFTPPEGFNFQGD